LNNEQLRGERNMVRNWAKQTNECLIVKKKKKKSGN